MKIKSSLISKGNFLRPVYVAVTRNNKNGSVDREGRGHARGKTPRAREENVYKSGVLAAWEHSRHIVTPLVVPPQLRLRNERRNSILMTYHYPDLGSASDWLEIWFIQSEALPRTTQIWVVTRHQYGISALLFQTSFCGETAGGVANVSFFIRLEFLDILIIHNSAQIITFSLSFLLSLHGDVKLKAFKHSMYVACSEFSCCRLIRSLPELSSAVSYLMTRE